MLDLALMQSIATQMMEQDQVSVEGKTLRVQRTSYQRLRSVKFELNGHEDQAIEQNAAKPSRWGQLARDGHKIVQFRDEQSGQYVAVSVNGKVREYERR